MNGENLIYWHGKPVGIETAGRICWFPSAPRDAIEAMKIPGKERVAPSNPKGLLHGES